MKPLPQRDRVEGGREGRAVKPLVSKSKDLVSKSKDLGTKSPNPSSKKGLSPRGIASILEGGLDSLGLNDFGRPWPSPRQSIIAKLVSEYDYDLCQKAAREARQIVQAQDRAPNITGLFQRKLEELAKVRRTVREGLK